MLCDQGKAFQAKCFVVPDVTTRLLYNYTCNRCIHLLLAQRDVEPYGTLVWRILPRCTNTVHMCIYPRDGGSAEGGGERTSRAAYAVRSVADQNHVYEQPERLYLKVWGRTRVRVFRKLCGRINFKIIVMDDIQLRALVWCVHLE